MSLWNIFDNMTATELIKFFGTTISLLVAINAAIIKLFSWLEKWRKKRNEEENEKQMINSIYDIQNHIDLICNSMRLILADTLNRKCKHYWQIDCIPSDEIDEFISEQQIFKLIDPDSPVNIKVQKAIESLKVKDID